MPSYKTTLLIGSLLLTAFAAIALRSMVAIQEPLWLDELHTAWCIDGPFSDVSRRAGLGNQTPFYFWCEWLVCQPFGLTEFSLRCPSVIFGSASAVVASLFVWSFNRSWVAAGLTGLLIAMDPHFIFYGSEARPYALVQLLSILQIIVFARDVGVQRGRNHEAKFAFNATLAILTAILLMTHLTSCSLIIAETIFLVLFMGRSPVRRAAVSLLVGSTAFIPLVLLTQDIFSRRSDWQTVSDSAQLLAEVQPNIIVYILVPVFICLLAWSLQKFRFKPTDTPYNQMTPWLSLTLIWGLTPLFLLWIADLSGLAPVALYRYAQAGAIAWPIFSGLLLCSIKSSSLKTIAATLILAIAFGFSGLGKTFFDNNQPAIYRAENWSAAIKLINAETAGGTVFLFPNLLEDHHALVEPKTKHSEASTRYQEYLAFPASGIYKIKNVEKVVTRPTRRAGRFTTDDVETVRLQGEAWFLIRGTPALVTAIIQEFEDQFDTSPSQSLNWDVRELPGSVVYVVKLSITANVE